MDKTRKFFAGGNTTKGFYSYFHEIIGDQANRIFILKGGPGSGKSTLMRKIGAQLREAGYEREEFYCSSDINSLDGIAVPKLKVAIIDGTAPHLIDPKYPGCVDEIINLGQYWDQSQIALRKKRIKELSNANKACYVRAYGYLRAAKELYDGIHQINSALIDLTKINQIIKCLKEQIFGSEINDVDQLGSMRHLFASALTPQGPVNELHNIMADFNHQIIIKGEPGTGKTIIVERLAQIAIENGFDVEAYHCPIEPDKIEHIAIPQLGVGVIASYPPHIYEKQDAKIINLNDYVDQCKRLEFQDILHQNFVIFEEIINLVFQQLRQAKAIHDDLELNYINAIDFTKFEQIKQEIVSEILSYANKE